MTERNQKFRVISFQIEEGDNIEEYYADCYISYHEERNYGADADNNRGVYAFFIDDVEIDQVYNSTGDEVEMTEHMERIITEKANSADLSY